MFALIIQGLARSSMTSVAILTLIEARGVDVKHSGSASGLYFSAAEVGGVFGPMTLGFISNATGSFSMGLSVLTCMCLVLLGCLWLLKRETNREL